MIPGSKSKPQRQYFSVTATIPRSSFYDWCYNFPPRRIEQELVPLAREAQKTTLVDLALKSGEIAEHG